MAGEVSLSDDTGEEAADWREIYSCYRLLYVYFDAGMSNIYGEQWPRVKEDARFSGGSLQAE